MKNFLSSIMIFHRKQLLIVGLGLGLMVIAAKLTQSNVYASDPVIQNEQQLNTPQSDTDDFSEIIHQIFP
ncbi:hypothetical protein QGP82_15095 [Leptothoe sp. LEGE 181152]|nr:hypothetical protein [Leptothoe sp. LEGE 181152]